MTDRRRERIRSCLHPGSEEWDDLDALVADRDRYKAQRDWLAYRVAMSYGDPEQSPYWWIQRAAEEATSHD